MMLPGCDSDKFKQAMDDAGLTPHSAMELQLNSATPIRYRVQGDKPGSDNGWYRISNNLGVMAGAFGSWKTGEKHAWCAKSDHELTDSERQLIKERRMQAEKEHALEAYKIKSEAAKKAAHLWDTAGRVKSAGGKDGQVPTGIAYLDAKRVNAFGIKRLNDGLVVPVRNASGELTSLQFIQPDGSKRFLTGGEINSCYFTIGRPRETLIICEGYATGATLYMATQLAVVVAFNAGNLSAVGRVMRDKYPECLLIFAADNDQTTVGNPGLIKAQVSAEQVGGRVLVPTFDANATIDNKSPTDYNDYYRLYGLPAVKSAVDALICLANSAQPMPELAGETPQSSIKKMTIDEFGKLVDDSDDFEFLTDTLVRQIALSRHLKKPVIEYLLSKIAKKSDTTKSALQEVYKSYSSRYGPNVPEQTSDDSIITQLNENHAVLPMGGRVVILNREHDPIQKKNYFTFSAKSDFELKYCNKKVFDHGDEVGYGEYWLNHPDRAEYKGMVFSPGEHEPGYLNLWVGWGLEPAMGECGQYLDFVLEVICSGDDELYHYIMNWCAHLVQRPQELPETALVFRGREGIGKDTFIRPLSNIVGREHFLMLSSLNQVTGRFSGHLANALLIFCNESVWGGDKSAQGVLKSMITDPIQPIEYKGRDLTMVKSFRRCIFATNEQWAVPRGSDDRRYVITDVSDAKKGNWNFFKELNSEMENGGTAALFNYLRCRDIINWHPRQIPNHIMQRGWDMKIMSANSIIRWWIDVLQQGYLEEPGRYSDDAIPVWPEIIPFKTLESLYVSYCTRYKIAHIECSQSLGKALHDFYIKRTRPHGPGTTRVWSYKLPPLNESREIFSKRWGIPMSYWDEEQELMTA